MSPHTGVVFPYWNEFIPQVHRVNSSTLSKRGCTEWNHGIDETSFLSCVVNPRGSAVGHSTKATASTRSRTLVCRNGTDSSFTSLRLAPEGGVCRWFVGRQSSPSHLGSVYIWRSFRKVSQDPRIRPGPRLFSWINTHFYLNLRLRSPFL